MQTQRILGGLVACMLCACAHDDRGNGEADSAASYNETATTLDESSGALDSSGGTGPGESGTTGAASTTGSGGETSGVTDSTGAATESSTGGMPVGLDSVGTLVVLGDSISDGGGQAPFYYDLLHADLTARYGAIEYHNNADSGSETDALVGQVDGLPNSLPGPVVVVITSGGNDMKSAIAAIIAGTDGPARAQMQANIGAALDALLAPGRFGPGVDVHVFEGNVYDASDGAGDFGDNGCAFGQGLPPIPTDMFFMNWNDAIRTTVEDSDQVAVDMHEHFYGHGYHGNPDWYASDCTHPNSIGHDELRRLFYFDITGEQLP